MKNRNNIVSIFLFIIIMLVQYSCAKEEITPTEQTNRVSPRMAVEDTTESADYSADFTGELPKFKTLKDALENVSFNTDQRLAVDIKAYNCRGTGQTLVAYNPNTHQLDFYDSKRFAVYWFKGNRPIVRNTNYRLSCVCKGKYAAIVINRSTQTGVGIAFHAITNFCPASEGVAAPTEIDN